MKNLVVLAIAVLLFSCEQQKLAYVDNNKMLEEYQEKIDFDASYKMKSDKLNKKRDSISQAYQIEAQAFQLRAQKLSDKKAQEEYGLIQQRAQFMGQQLQQEEQSIQLAGQVEMDSMVSKVKRSIENYAKTKGYSFVFSGGNGGSVLYGPEAADITDEIVKVLNDSYKQE